jgi:hypothetical protein
MRYLGGFGAALAAVLLAAAAPATAHDGDELALPEALAAEDLSQETARGEGEAGDVQNIGSSASANASIENVTVDNPASTGSVMLGDMGGAARDVSILQISTGSGNIQQGVSAMAFAP